MHISIYITQDQIKAIGESISSKYLLFLGVGKLWILL